MEGSILYTNPFQVDVFIKKIQERPLSGLQPRKRKLLVLEQDAIPNASITNINLDFDRLMSRLNPRLNTRPNMPPPFYSTQRLPLTHKQEFYSTTMPLKGSHIVPNLLKSQYYREHNQNLRDFQDKEEKPKVVVGLLDECNETKTSKPFQPQVYLADNQFIKQSKDEQTNNKSDNSERSFRRKSKNYKVTIEDAIKFLVKEIHLKMPKLLTLN